MTIHDGAEALHEVPHPAVPVPLESIEAPQPDRRRVFRLPRARQAAGTMTVAAEAGEGLDTPESAEVDMLGLEEDFAELHELWAAHDKPFNDFVQDPANLSALHEVISTKRGGNGERSERRKVARIGYQDLVQFAVATRLRGRLTATLSPKMFTTIANSLPESKEVRKTIKKVEPLYRGLLWGQNFIKPMPELAQFNQRRRELVKASKSTYVPILRKELLIDKKVSEQIESPEGAQRFLDALLAHAGSDTPQSKLFVSHFITSQAMYGENSLVDDALKLVHDRSADGHLVEDFVAEKVNNDEGQNILGYIAGLWPKDAAVSLTEAIADTHGLWPAELRADYMRHILKHRAHYVNGIGRLSSTHVRKDHLHPDRTLYAQVVDRLFRRLHVKPTAGYALPQEMVGDYSHHAVEHLALTYAPAPELKFPAKKK